MIVMELPTKLLIGATGLILVVILAAIDPTILAVLGLLGVVGVILTLLAGRTEVEAALAMGLNGLHHSIELITHAIYST